MNCMGEEFSMIAVNVEIRQTLHSLIRVPQITLKAAVLDAMASQTRQTSLIPVVFAQVWDACRRTL